MLNTSSRRKSGERAPKIFCLKSRTASYKGRGHLKLLTATESLYENVIFLKVSSFFCFLFSSSAMKRIIIIYYSLCSVFICTDRWMGKEKAGTLTNDVKPLTRAFIECQFACSVLRHVLPTLAKTCKLFGPPSIACHPDEGLHLMKSRSRLVPRAILL